MTIADLMSAFGIKDDKSEFTLVFNEDLAKQAIKGINRFNQKSWVWVQDEIKTKVQPINYNESTHYEPYYRIYVAKIGKGNNPICIFVEGHETIGLGDRELYLQRLNYNFKELKIEFLTDYLDNYEEIALVCEKVGIPIQAEGGYRSKDELLKDLIELQKSEKPVLYKEGLGVPKDELKKVDNCLDMARYALKADLEQDPLIGYLFSALIPQVCPQDINPKHYMPYAPHSIIFTNPKVGKSFTAHSIGEVKERSSEANLLGYGTANERVQGALDKCTKPVFLDEIQEEKDSQKWGKLHTYLETGQTSIAKGKGVTTIGWASLIFMGNPKLRDQQQIDYSLTRFQQVRTLGLFQSTLSTITSNYEPFGTRMGIVLFRTNLKTIKGKPVGQEEQEKLGSILHTISTGYRKEFTSLFHNDKVRAWLNEEFDENYKKQLLNFSERIQYIEISEFTKGQVLSYKHLRGTALRLAWLDYLSDHIKTGQLDFDAVIKLAQQHLKELQKINMESFNFISELEETPEFRELLKSIVDNIKPTYLKYLVYTFFEWKKENLTKRIAVLNELNDYYGSVRKKFDTGKYDIFFDVKENVLKDIGKTNDVIYSFGLSMSKIDSNTQAVHIDDPVKADKFYNLYFNQGSGTKTTKGTGHDGQDNTLSKVEEEQIEETIDSTKSTNSTQTLNEDRVIGSDESTKSTKSPSTLGEEGLEKSKSTESTQTLYEVQGIKDSENISSTIPSDEDLVEFVKERGNSGYPMTEFVLKYGQERLDRLKMRGDLFENPAGVLRVVTG